MKHFLKETDFTREEAADVFSLARRFKLERGRHEKPLTGQSWAMIFAKSSTRTRVSFDVGIQELGGHPLFLGMNDIQMGRGETIGDTAKVLSRFVHGIVIRTFKQSDLEGLAAHGRVPVVNALTDFLHPLPNLHRRVHGGRALGRADGRSDGVARGPQSRVSRRHLLQYGEFVDSRRPSLRHESIAGRSIWI